MTRLMVFLLCLSVNTCLSAQTTVSGQVEWHDKAISSYPAHVIASSDTGEIQGKSSVNDDGTYVLDLPSGTFLIKSERNFHWQGEQFVRINDADSHISVTVKEEKAIQAPVLKLSITPYPDTIPAKGHLLEYARLDTQLMDQFVQTNLNYFEIPGAALAVIKNGEVVYHKSYGIKNSKSKEPVTDDTLFETGSITKAVFGFVVMRLYERGLIDLDKPLFDYLPYEDVAHDPRSKLITARHVLSHQTGFPNWAKRNKNGQFDLKFTPGSQYGYSGEGFEYLKMVLEKITNKTIDTILEDELIKPLKLNNFYFKGHPSILEKSANGHRFEEPKEIRNFNRVMVSYTLTTDIKSFSEFALALRNKKGLKAQTYQEFLKIQSSREDQVHWGLGIKIEDTELGRNYGHSGSTNSGFVSNFLHYEALDMGFIIFTNSNKGGIFALPYLNQFLITGKGVSHTR